MTNPYSQLESFTYAEDCLPVEEQIKPTSPEATKGIMEVWRDTANQLDAERMRSEKAHKDYVSAHESYTHELQAKLKVQEDLRKEQDLKKLKIQELNGFKEQYKEQKEHLEKLRRHRDELAEMVKKARESRTALSEWLDGHDNGDILDSPIWVLREVVASLSEDLGVHEGKEADNETN